MLNYLSGRYFQRFHLSTRTRVELSPRTLHMVHSLTNRVHVILYYDKEDPLYGNISELLKEYHLNDPAITVDTVDYIRDPGAAQDLKIKYNLGSSTNKDLVVFDCGGNTGSFPATRWENTPSNPSPTQRSASFAASSSRSGAR